MASSLICRRCSCSRNFDIFFLPGCLRLASSLIWWRKFLCLLLHRQRHIGNPCGRRVVESRAAAAAAAAAAKAANKYRKRGKQKTEGAKTILCPAVSWVLYRNEDVYGIKKSRCMENFCQTSNSTLYKTRSFFTISGKCAKENGAGSKRNDFRKETFRPHFGLALLPCACGSQVRTLCVSAQEEGVLSKGKRRRRRRRSKEGGGGKGNSYLHDVVSLILIPPLPPLSPPP